MLTVYLLQYCTWVLVVMIACSFQVLQVVTKKWLLSQVSSSSMCGGVDGLESEIVVAVVQL